MNEPTPKVPAMQDLVDQPPTATEANGVPAPDAEKIDHREQQRSALRDLVELSTSSAATEAEIDERLKKSLAEAEDNYKKGVREIEERFTQLAEGLSVEHQKRLQEARAVAEREMSAVHKRDRDARQRVRNEMEPTERDIKSKFDQAV